MQDIELLRLQYEILNLSAEDIAKKLGDISVDMVKKEIEDKGWKQWWPDDSPFMIPEPDDEMEEKEVFALQSEQYIDKAKRRLAVYTLAKEIYLATKYMALEASLIDKAKSICDAIQDADAEAAQKMSNLFKNMTSKNPMQALQSISFGEEDGGIPTVIIRNLTGQR